MPDLVETYVENRWIVQPNHTNSYNMAHGGTVVKWMDELGAMAAMRFAGEPCVTARMEQVNFERPVPVGDIALVEAYVYEAGQTSVKVRITAHREDPLTSEQELTSESFFVYVAIDENQRPTAVPSLSVDSEEGKQLREAALADEASMYSERQHDRSD